MLKLNFKFFIVSLLLVLVFVNASCTLTPSITSSTVGSTLSFTISGASQSYNTYCNYSTASGNPSSQYSGNSFQCTFSGAGTYNVSAVSGTESCNELVTVSSSTSSLSVSITGLSEDGNSISLSGTPNVYSGGVLTVSGTSSVSSGSITVSSSCSNTTTVSLTSTSWSAPILINSLRLASCTINVYYSNDETPSASLVVNVQPASSCTACNGFESCPGSLINYICTVNSGAVCSYVVGQCGYKPSCSLSLNTSNVQSPGGAVLVTGVLNGLSSVPTGWTVQCGNDENSQGSCSSTLQSNGLYNGQCTATCFYNSTTGARQLQIHSTVGSVDCGEAFVTVNPLTVNYKPVCTVNIQPSSARNGSVNLNVDYTGSGQSVSSASVDCGGGVLPSDIARLACSSYYNGASWEGSCAGACFYNTSQVQVNVPLNVNVGGASCQTIFTLLPSSSSQASASGKNVSNAGSGVLTVSLFNVSSSENKIDSSKTLEVWGFVNSTLPVDSVVCVNPPSTGSCDCSLNASGFDCFFQPLVNGNYTLVFKSGLSEANASLSLIPGSALVVGGVSSGGFLDWLAGLLGSVWSFLKRII